MHNPVPYSYHGVSPAVSNYNLNDTRGFPCKGLYDIVEVTTIEAGTSHLVEFTGSVVHGGGSCQFALTYEFPPPADPARWKTIYTIIGGCPASAAGNLPEGLFDQFRNPDGVHCGNDYGVECVREFLIPFGKGLPSGNATFAWMWWNKMGNREAYMTCAPVRIINGQGEGDNDYLKGLPGMFLANVPPATCTTGKGVLNIPNPGKYGRVLEEPNPESAGNCPKADKLPVFECDEEEEGDGGGSSQAGVPTKSAGAVATSSGVGGVVATQTTSSMAEECPTGASETASGVAVPTEIPGPGSGTGSGTVTGGATGIEDDRGQPCPLNGAFVCFNSSFFGLCVNGIAIPQSVAQGMACNRGDIVRLGTEFRRKRARGTEQE